MIGISNKTIYAIMALEELSLLEDNERLTIKEIAQNASIPKNFLEQILLSLRQNQILMSIKGAKGGYKLNKKLNEISLKEIVVILERDIFSPIENPNNPALNLFWNDLNRQVLHSFDIPLSKIDDYKQQLIHTLNYSI